MNRTFATISHLAAGAWACALLTACGGGGGSGGTGNATLQNSPPGNVSVSLTDAPACGFDAVNVTVVSVRVNASANAAQSDAGWTDIALTPARRIDLLSLTNGARTLLGQTSLPSGHYAQVRLVLDTNAGTGLANSVVPTGGQERSLTTPGEVQTGVKAVGEFDVVAGRQTDLVLDFDACQSVVSQGNGRYLLSPVVRLLAPTTTTTTGT